MTHKLDLHDIQGNIVYGYGHFGYPKARYVFFKFNDAEKGRGFVDKLIPLITTSAPLNKQQMLLPKPMATTNVAFTYAGLRELGIPDASLRTFPADFRMGMKARLDILGDDGASAPEHWDPIWRGDNWDVHMFLSINGVSEDKVAERYDKIVGIMNAINGAEGQDIQILIGHRGPDGVEDLPYQPASAISVETEVDGKKVSMSTSWEHFHYTDGISDPYFKGMGSPDPDAAVGAGKPTRKDPQLTEGWEPLETGEFVLGHRDEVKEYPIAPEPRLLSYNGSFMAYRKLHQNVGAYNDYIHEASKQMELEDENEAFETLAAQFAGRWRNGAPLATFPTYKEAQEFGRQWDNCTLKLFLNPDAYSDEEKNAARELYQKLKRQRKAFNYNEDISGSKCPMTSHMRRVNPRGALEYGGGSDAYETPGALVNRRRILRRGLPYGDSSDRTSNDGDHGIILIAVNASIERQFEFIQQQWINYGNDFKLSNDKDPLIGNHRVDKDGSPKGRTIVPGDKASGRLPLFCSNMPRFVETRGGDYFFIPSMTALRMIGEGIIDPT
jgi:Dyp-type peroxidase family